MQYIKYDFHSVSRRCSAMAKSFPCTQRSQVWVLPGIRSDDGAEIQSLVSIQNITELNPKYLRSAYDVKAFVLLTAIHPSDGDVKPGGHLGAFQNIRLMPAPSFDFTLPHLIVITLTLYHHKNPHTLILVNFSFRQLYIILKRGTLMWCGNWKWVTVLPLSAV